MANLPKLAKVDYHLQLHVAIYYVAAGLPAESGNWARICRDKLMKKAVFLLLLLLTCCTPAPVNPTRPSNDSSISDQKAFLEAFDASEKCPQICWLGINPGVTTAEEARILLRASDKIDQKEFHVGKDGIYTNWYYESTKELYTYVDIKYDHGVVGSITIDDIRPFRVSDFVNLLGEPDKISIYIDYEPDAILIPYSLYYSSRRIIIGSRVYEKVGPTLDDNVSNLYLNIDFNDKDAQMLPWLGFGHLQEYLPGQELPPFPLPVPFNP